MEELTLCCGGCGVPLYWPVRETYRQGCRLVRVSLSSVAWAHAAPHLGDRDLGSGPHAHIRDGEGDEPRDRKGAVEAHSFWAERQARRRNPPAWRRL